LDFILAIILAYRCASRKQDKGHIKNEMLRISCFNAIFDILTPFERKAA